MPALRLRGGPGARRGRHLRDGRRARRRSSTSSPATRRPRRSSSSPASADAINRELIYLDVWENIDRRIKIAPLLGKVDCPCCQQRQFEWLEGEHGSQTTSLCGRNAVQVTHRVAGEARTSRSWPGSCERVGRR